MNEKITAIIVDDNKGAITDLKNMLKTHCPNVEVLATYEYSSDALKEVNLGKIKPELLFLDIQMDNDRIDGLELFELILKANTNMCNAIFVTGHNNDKFINQALELNCLDYLLKPINKEALTRAVEKQKEDNSNYLNERIDNAKNLKDDQQIKPETKMAIKIGNTHVIVKLFDICYCESDGNYSFIYTKQGNKIHANYSLKKLTEMLPEDYFYRCHNKYIIGGLHVQKFKPTIRDGIVTISINNEKEEIPVSRSRRDELVEVLKKILHK